IYDPKSKQKLRLWSGTYELELKGKPTGLRLDIEKVTLKRGDVEIAKIERVHPDEKGKGKEKWAVAPLPDKVGLVREIPIQGRPCACKRNTFSPDSRLVAIAVANPEWWTCSFRIVEVATGRLVQEVGLPGERLTNGEFWPDGERFLTCTHVGESVVSLQDS